MQGAGAVLGGATTQAGIAVAAGCDGAGDHPLPFVKALHLRAQFLDHAHRFMAHGQPFRHRVLAPQDMHIGTADRRGGDANQRIQWPDVGDRFVIQHDAVLVDKDRRFHECHGMPPGHCVVVVDSG
ncbi:hypothetical protein D3C76_1419810 [compost metagenome]